MLRLYATGRICVESPALTLDEGDLPSRQARALLAFLICERAHATAKEQLAEALWHEDLPKAWHSALKSLISKLRRFLSEFGTVTGTAVIESQFGCYQLRLPEGSWVDLEEAYNAIDRAEGMVRYADYDAAWGFVNVGLAISRRPFLPGDDTPWVLQQRQQIKDLLVRALDCYINICLNTNQETLAVKMSLEALELDHYRETSYYNLMSSHMAAGNPAEALRVYQSCKDVLSRELGVEPSSAIEGLHLQVLDTSIVS